MLSVAFMALLVGMNADVHGEDPAGSGLAELSSDTMSDIFADGQAAQGRDPSAGDSAGGDSAAKQNEAGTPDADNLDKLLNLAEQDVGRLSDVKVTAPALQEVVTTVSRQKSTVGRSPAAVYVITNEMIRRSGARSIPEVLRMAPGVQVARIDSNKWAVSIRGFNGRFANKLLVQIDGRRVYTPLFGGVFWDVQDVLLEDVERIEVIRGPGATIWGANAVNGVINIITKSAGDTQGAYVHSGGGTERGFGEVRYGGEIGDGAYFRLYGKWFERGRGFASFDNAHDDWRMGRGGFRLDWDATCADTVTVQGDFYDGYTGRRNIFPDPNPPDFTATVDDDAHVSGNNVLFRHKHEIADDSDWTLQVYFDKTERHWLRSGFLEDRETFDVDFQHRFPMGDWNALIWGFGYRRSRDNIRSVPFVFDFTPDNRTINLFSYFVQDEITLLEDRLYFTAGSKFQHNDFTGFEIQPTGRLLWTPTDRHSIWASVSRAVRTPTRAEDDVTIRALPTSVTPVPVFPIFVGDRSVDSEVLVAYELGMRHQPVKEFSWDLAVFFHNYDDLLGVRPGMTTFGLDGVSVPLLVRNNREAETYGFELSSSYQIRPWWRVFGSYSFLRIQVHADPFAAPDSETEEGESPRNQLYVQSSWDLSERLSFDMTGRYVDNLPALDVSNYFVSDMRLAWRMTDDLEFAVVGRHLFDSVHPEFATDRFTGNVATEVEREVFATLTWER